MAVEQTSLEAFRSISKELGKRQRDVYEAIKELGEADNLMISKYLGIPINSTTPRCKELREKGLVELSKVGLSEYTGKRVTYWRCVK